MSAISRCSRISCILRRVHTISRRSSVLSDSNWKIISKGIHQPPKLLRTISHQPVLERCYSVKTESTEDVSTTGEKNVGRYSENFPASPFWKAYDFESEWGENYNFNYFCHLTYSHFSSKRDYPVPAFYAFMSLVDKKTTFDEEEMLMVAKSVSYTNKMLTPAEKIKWLDYFIDRFSSLDLKLENSFFNLVMNIYLLHWIPFSPVEFLSKMEKFGVTPNGMSLERFLMAYCRNGDVKSATQVLEHMKACKFPLSNKAYASLVYGNFVAGDKETGMALFRDTVGVGFELDVYAYLNVILGHAIIGDFDGVKQMVKEMKENNIFFNTFVLCNIAERVAECSNREVFDYVIELLKESGGNYFHDASIFIPELCLKGKYEMAYQLFQGLNDPHAKLFYKGALFANMPMQDLVQFSNRMKNDGVKNPGLDEYYGSAIQTGCYDRAIAVLPHIASEGIEMRPQDSWPLIRYFTILRDLDGLKSILPYINKDTRTISTYLIPSMKSFGVSVEQFSQMLKDNMETTEERRNGFILHYCLKTDGLKAASELATTFRCLVDITDLLPLNTTHLLSVTNRNNWELTSELIFKMDNLPRKYAESLINRIIALKVDIQDIKAMIIKKGIKINQDAIPDVLKSVLSSEERVKIEKLSVSSEGLQNMPYEKLILLENASKDGMVFKRLVLNGAFRRKDWPVFEKYLKKIDINSIYNVRLLYTIAAYYAREEGTINRCIHLLEKIIMKHGSGKISVEIAPLNQILEGLCAFGHQKEACEFLQAIEIYNTGLNRLSDASNLFEMAPSPENTELAKALLEAMKRCNYFEHVHQRTVLQSFWAYLVKTKDLESIYEGFELLHSHFNFIPPLKSVFCNLVKAEDKVNLQAAFDKFSEIVLEQHELLHLAAAFFECGIKDKAKKVLDTPGLRIDRVVVDQILNDWMREKKFTFAEQFCKVVECLPGNFTRADTLFCQLKIMCKKENPNVKECIDFFENKFDEEGIIPANHQTRFMASFLREKRVPLPPSIKTAQNEWYVREGRATATEKVKKKAPVTVQNWRLMLQSQTLEELINEELSARDKKLMFVAALWIGDEKLIREVKEAVFQENKVTINDACHFISHTNDVNQEPVWRNFVNAIENKPAVYQKAISLLAQAARFDIMEKVYDMAKNDGLTMEQLAKTRGNKQFYLNIEKMENEYRQLGRQLRWEPTSTWTYNPVAKQRKQNETNKGNITETASEDLSSEIKDVSEDNSVDVITDNAEDISLENETDRIQDTAEIITDKDGTDK